MSLPEEPFEPTTEPDGDGSLAPTPEPDGVGAFEPAVPDEAAARGAFRHIGERDRYVAERLRVVTATFVGPDGFTFEREVVRTFDAVCVVAVESDSEHALLVRQYRGPVGSALLEIPAGKLDVEGETTRDCAARELAEEVGVLAGELTELASFYNSPGFCDEMTTCFLARELSKGERWSDGIEERHLVIERVALGETEELVAAGEIRDAKTITGLLLARSHLAARDQAPALPPAW